MASSRYEMLRVKAFSIRQDLSPMLQQHLNHSHRAMFASEVQGDMIRIRERIDTCRSGKEKFDAVEMSVDNRVDQGGEVVVVYEVDGFLICYTVVSQLNQYMNIIQQLTVQEDLEHFQSSVKAGIMQRNPAVDIRSIHNNID